uniref:Putative secreted protein n=1 Tax=Desmodus rotundus TaxID=9430 RepID=K9IG96_DESRO
MFVSFIFLFPLSPCSPSSFPFHLPFSSFSFLPPFLPPFLPSFQQPEARKGWGVEQWECELPVPPLLMGRETQRKE